MDGGTAQVDDQVASKDEYEIALAEGIEDETLLDSSDVKKFSITSYGADYTVDSLVKRMKGQAFKIPDFQRRYVWVTEARIQIHRVASHGAAGARDLSLQRS